MAVQLNVHCSEEQWDGSAAKFALFVIRSKMKTPKCFHDQLTF